MFTSNGSASGAPQLAGVEPDRVDVLGVLAQEVRVRCRAAPGPARTMHDGALVPRDVARQPGVPGRVRPLAAVTRTRSPTANAGRLIDGADGPGRGGRVVGLVRLGDGRLLDVLDRAAGAPGAVDRPGAMIALSSSRFSAPCSQRP